MTKTRYGPAYFKEGHGDGAQNYVICFFEYILAFVSILVGLAVADIAASLHRLLRARARVRWNALPLMAAMLAVLLVVSVWWGFYRFAATASLIAYDRFIPVVAELFVMFLLASAALPDEVPLEGIDLAVYYDENARYFWTLFVLFLLLSAMTHAIAAESLAALRAELLSRRYNLILAAVLASLAVVRRRAYHYAIQLFLLLFLFANWSHLRLR